MSLCNFFMSLCSLFLAVGCIRKPANDSSVHHAEGQIVSSQLFSERWENIERSLYVDKIYRTWSYFGSNVLPSSDARSQQFQALVDKISEGIRKNYVSAVEANHIPKPQVVAVEWDEVGGHVDTVDVCYRLPVAIQNAGLPCSGENTISFTIEGRLSTQSECLLEKEPPALAVFVADLSDRFPGCQIEMAGDGLRLAGSCVSAQIPSCGKRLEVKAMTPYIALPTGLQNIPEASQHFLVAHELVHYYKAHGIKPFAERYYRPSHSGGNTEPVADPSLNGDSLAAGADAGYYTMEQEADEVTVEIMAKMGYSGNSIVEAILDTSTNQICREKWQRGWKDENGKPDIEAPSNRSSHHRFCYRVFNVDRQVKAHHYNGGATQNSEGSSGPGVGICCPDGYLLKSVGNAGGTYCESRDGSRVLGPFTDAMKQKCAAWGGGAACANSDWAQVLALRARGDGFCPFGASLDPATGYCVEAGNAFGPFPPSLVAKCKAAGGGPACDSGRWGQAFLLSLMR